MVFGNDNERSVIKPSDVPTLNVVTAAEIGHWERGYRVHGFWSASENNMQLGRVGIGPQAYWDGVYHWWVRVAPSEEGQSTSLRQAKRIVEKKLIERLTKKARHPE